MPKDFNTEDLDGKVFDLGAPFGRCSADRLPNGTYAISSIDAGVTVAENVGISKMQQIIAKADEGKIGAANAITFFAPQ